MAPGKVRGTGAAAPVAARPSLRGWLHLACFVGSLPAGAALVAGAGSSEARAAGTVYALGLSGLFGVSALYHRLRWSPSARRRMQRMDHAMIFVMIAGSYTPLCVLVLGEPLGRRLLVAAWLGAGAGVLLALFDLAQRPVLGLACYVGLGWGIVVALPQLADRLAPAQVGLLAAGGVVYTVGGLVLGTRWPDPAPAVFGYHELWHLMVAVAALCHFVVIASVVRAGG